MRLRMPATLLFGYGVLADLPAVLGEVGAARPLIVTDPGVAAAGWAGRVRQEVEADVWDGIEPDPDEGHADRCGEALRAGGYDAVIAVGGGSVIDAAKVAAVLATQGGRTSDYFGFDRVPRPGLPLVVVPTTAGSGAEVSSHAVIVQREPRKKEVVSSIHLLPRAAVVDPEATTTLSTVQTAYTVLDGLIHALEAFVARRATPFTDTFARQAVPRIASALPRVLAGSTDPADREELSLGCLYSGVAMANANAGVIHALGYPLTGRYGVPHGLANALMAAAALERTWPALPERYGELSRLLGGADGEGGELPERMRGLLAAAGIRDTLASWGVAEADLPDLAEAATHFKPVLQNTPVALTGDDLLAIYRSAWSAGA
ncbi:MAG TPA: iron-containing alcohol dehydrogenase [Thermoanaerobaculia bacterium]|nr:iron-containing alcohol dehydrogenase [Thermoanaerobaculia bacterium]